MPDQTPSMPPLTDAEIAAALRPLYQPEALAALLSTTSLMADFRAVALAQAAKDQAVADERVREALERGFEAGWRTVARDWAMRDDLISDIGSPAYIADRDRALAIPIISLGSRESSGT